MVLKSIKEVIRTGIGKRSLQSGTIKEIANWLHDLEFLIIKVMISAIGIHHLYVYTLKTMF
jgi:RNA-binding protein YhbY